MKATRTCTIESCDRKHYARGWCSSHYLRWFKNGSPGTAAIGQIFPAHDSDEYAQVVWGRLMARRTVTPSGCWEWNGSRTRDGYGRIKWRKDARFTHRVAYEIAKGVPVRDELVMDHLCRNPPCFNPEHLEPVEQRINLLRGYTVTATRAAKTHCPQGHEYTLENTYVSRKGQRHCRTCLRNRDSAKRARRADRK